MRRSVIALAALALAFGAAGCSFLTRPTPTKPPPVPLYEARTATLAITMGIQLPAAIALPPGFAPAGGYPPIWLGTEIGVAGEVEGKTVVLCFSGAKLANRLVLAHDVGAAAGGAAVDAMDGLYVIYGAKLPQRFHQPGCALSRLSWSPNRRLAVAQGDVRAPVALIDYTAQTCQKLNIATPIKVLGWSPDSTAFIYTAPNVDARSVGIFRYELATGAITLVAVSSSAAAFTSDGAIIAVVNRELSWRRVAAQPQAHEKGEIAAFDPKQSEIRINSLGFETRAALLARGSMVFSAASNDAVIDAYLPAVPVPIRELIEYSYPTQSAFVLARGPAQGPVMMSWSPDGHIVAIIDGDAHASTLTLLVPPR